ncbi:hypothetical protein [Propylenella binzhouense]
MAVIRDLFSRLELFGIGLSWGGFESLVMLSDKPLAGEGGGYRIRIHAGLESASDLVADMGRAFRRAAEKA